MAFADTGGFDLGIEVSVKELNAMMSNTFGFTANAVAIDGAGAGKGVSGFATIYFDRPVVALGPMNSVVVTVQLSQSSEFVIQSVQLSNGMSVSVGSHLGVDGKVPLSGILVYRGTVHQNHILDFTGPSGQTQLAVDLERPDPNAHMILTLIRSQIHLEIADAATRQAVFDGIFQSWANAIKASFSTLLRSMSLGADFAGTTPGLAATERAAFMGTSSIFLCSHFSTRPASGFFSRRAMPASHLAVPVSPGDPRDSLAVVLESNFFVASVLRGLVASRFPGLVPVTTLAPGNARPTGFALNGAQVLPVTNTQVGDISVPMTATVNGISAAVSFTNDSRGIILFAHMSGTVGEFGTTYECAFEIPMSMNVMPIAGGVRLAIFPSLGASVRTEWRQTVPAGWALATLLLGVAVYDAPDVAALNALARVLGGSGGTAMFVELIGGSIRPPQTGLLSILPNSATTDPSTMILGNGLVPLSQIFSTNPLPLQDLLIRF